jgi:hypothetical protein
MVILLAILCGEDSRTAGGRSAGEDDGCPRAVGYAVVRLSDGLERERRVDCDGEVAVASRPVWPATHPRAVAGGVESLTALGHIHEKARSQSQANSP